MSRAVAQPQEIAGSTNMSARSHLPQRNSVCGGTPGLTGEGNGCGKKRLTLQRHPTNQAEPATAPPIVHDVLRSPGQPLDVNIRASMEPRFGHDFSRVRVHTDTKAAESAREMNALAYTVGQDLVFEAGQYVPGSEAGRRLLAHELTHVVQQSATARPLSSLRLSSFDDPSEQQADQLSDQIVRGNHGRTASWQTFSGLQRTIRVDGPEDPIPNPTGRGVVRTNAETVQYFLDKLCPTGGVLVDFVTGVVNVPSRFCTAPWWQGGWPYPFTESPAEASATPTGCTCLCDLANSGNAWTIVLDDNTEKPETVPDDRQACLGSRRGIGGRITVPSPRSRTRWGAATVGGELLDLDPWLLLGHELCGHARLCDKGRGWVDKPEHRGLGGLEGEEAGHQVVVAMENELRKEHGFKDEDLRATFKGPYCGESYWRASKKAPAEWFPDPARPSRTFLQLCTQWREDYSRAVGKEPPYDIKETIP